MSRHRDRNVQHKDQNPECVAGQHDRMWMCEMRVRAVVSTGSGELVTRGDSRTSEALQILAQMTLAPHSDIEENGEDAEGAEASKHV